MNLRLFMSLVGMSFLWVGSQIPLYLFGSVIPLIYSEIGGAAGAYVWLIIGYMIPLAAVCPFVGALSDLFGRRLVAVTGQLLLIIGPIVLCTAKGGGRGLNVGVGMLVVATRSDSLTDISQAAWSCQVLELA